jgi:hypothetical protein
VAEATTRNIWKLIDPKSAEKGQFRAEPIKPAPATYPKRLVRPPRTSRIGSASSSVTTGGIQQEEEVEEGGTPTNISEMTALGRDTYKVVLSEYHFEWRLYETECQNINQLSAWIRKTVTPELFDITTR